MNEPSAKVLEKVFSEDLNVFPPTKDQIRLQQYNFHTMIYEGHHYEAFKQQINSFSYNKDYDKLRYVMANFAALLSRIMADMLFSEPVNVKVEKGDQEWVDAFIHENNLNTQLYEAALDASYLGDAVFKLRVGKRNPNNPEGKPSVIAEEISPVDYFPQIDPFNIKSEPKSRILAWKFKVDKDEYLRVEKHSFRKIENRVYLLKSDKIDSEVDLSIAGIEGLQPEQIVLIDESLLLHVTNAKTGLKYYGVSDYFDLVPLFYAINNRMTKVDNILDKHSDPILALPPGILDEDGEVKRSKLHMIELPADGNGEKPEYIVWNANLEAAFSEVDKLVEMLFMVSETSPDLLGMGKGQAESGRALKLKILRTLAKAKRKQLYFDKVIKDLIYRAQLLAKAYNVEAGGKKLTKEPEMPEVEWADGLPMEGEEAIEPEVMAIDAGITTRADAIQRAYGVDQDTAEEMVKQIDEEKKLSMPTMDLSNFTNEDDEVKDTKKKV